MFDVNSPAIPVDSPPRDSVCEFRAIAHHIAGNTTLSGRPVRKSRFARHRRCSVSLHLNRAVAIRYMQRFMPHRTAAQGNCHATCNCLWHDCSYCQAQRVRLCFCATVSNRRPYMFLRFMCVRANRKHCAPCATYFRDGAARPSYGNSRRPTRQRHQCATDARIGAPRRPR